jgi:hypothetical protein
MTDKRVFSPIGPDDWCHADDLVPMSGELIAAFSGMIMAEAVGNSA